MGGQRGQRVPEQEVSGSSGGPAVSPTEYGSNEFMAAYLRATRSPKQRCEDHYGAGLSIHTPEAWENFKVDADVGGWCTDDGERAYGAEGSASWEENVDLPGSRIKGSGPSATGQLGWLGDQLALGGQLNLAETSYESTDDWDASRDDDDYYRVGLSLGMGWAGRVHHSDKDQDGNPEYGLGFDYGVGSMDYKTETPIRDAVLFGLLGPVNAINWMFGDSVLESFGVGGDVDSAPAPDLSETRGSPGSFGPATSVARETVPPIPAAPALPENSVFAQPSPASFLDAHPGSVFGDR